VRRLSRNNLKFGWGWRIGRRNLRVCCRSRLIRLLICRGAISKKFFIFFYFREDPLLKLLNENPDLLNTIEQLT
jgi:hypothetical protein